MIRVHDQDRLRAPPVGGVDERTLFAGILHQTLDGGGVRADDADNAVTVDHIAKADVDQFHSGSLLDVLDLLADFFDFGFQLNDQPCDGNILALGADGVGFAVQLLR